MLSEYFTRKEFECKCGCGFDTVDCELLEVLNKIREHFGPVVINSACRCQSHNKSVGGRLDSFHLIGRAADITVKEATPDEVYTFLSTQYPNHFGVICYNTFVHVDSRGSKYRFQY